MFISVKEAMELTGMSSTSIYRLCNKRINTLYIRKEDNKFLIDKDFILATYPPDLVKITEQIEPDIYNQLMQTDVEIKKIENIDQNALFIINNESSESFEMPEDFKKSESEEAVPATSIAQIHEVQKNVVDKEPLLNHTENPVQIKPKPLKIFNWETIVGISVSILVVGLLVYLVYLDIR